MITVLIIDDEMHARKRIADLLSSFEAFRIIQECKNGQEALEAIKKMKPDVIFLDVQMPGISGLDVVKQAHYEPVVIFVTAFEMHALEAFELRAVDYLLKPFSNERFKKTISKIEELLEMRQSIYFKEKIETLIKENKNRQYIQNLSVKAKGVWLTVNLSEVGYIRTEGNYVRVYTRERFFLHRLTIQELENTLDPASFLRIHRGIIINLNWIKSVRYLVQNFEYGFVLSNDVQLTSGRSYKSNIESVLEKQPELLFRHA